MRYESDLGSSARTLNMQIFNNSLKDLHYEMMMDIVDPTLEALAGQKGEWNNEKFKKHTKAKNEELSRTRSEHL